MIWTSPGRDDDVRIFVLFWTPGAQNWFVPRWHVPHWHCVSVGLHQLTVPHLLCRRVLRHARATALVCLSVMPLSVCLSLSRSMDYSFSSVWGSAANYSSFSSTSAFIIQNRNAVARDQNQLGDARRLSAHIIRHRYHHGLNRRPTGETLKYYNHLTSTSRNTDIQCCASTPALRSMGTHSAFSATLLQHGGCWDHTLFMNPLWLAPAAYYLL